MFDEKADTYDSWYQTGLGSFVDEVETKLAFDMFTPEKNMKVLDVGCGTGNFTLKLAQKQCFVVGIDISEKMLKIAREKIKDSDYGIEFYNMDIYSLEFPDEAFDAVFSMATFEFIHKPHAAFMELQRVLKPGGQILIGTINRDSHWGRKYLKAACRPDSIFRFASFMTLEELEGLDRENLLDSRECLFIPPSANKEQINWEEEKRLSKINSGGYICALWRKPK